MVPFFARQRIARNTIPRGLRASGAIQRTMRLTQNRSIGGWGRDYLRFSSEYDEWLNDTPRVDGDEEKLIRRIRNGEVISTHPDSWK